MTCLQHLWHSLAYTAQRKRSGEKQQRVAQREKGKRIPWRVECVQHKAPRLIPEPFGACTATAAPLAEPSITSKDVVALVPGVIAIAALKA